MSLTQSLVNNVTTNGVFASKGIYSYSYSTTVNAGATVDIGMNGGTFSGYTADEASLYFLVIQIYNSHNNAVYFFMEKGSFLQSITSDSNISLSYDGESYFGGKLHLTNKSGSNNTFIIVLTIIGLRNF